MINFFIRKYASNAWSFFFNPQRSNRNDSMDQCSKIHMKTARRSDK